MSDAAHRKNGDGVFGPICAAAESSIPATPQVTSEQILTGTVPSPSGNLSFIAQTAAQDSR